MPASGAGNHPPGQQWPRFSVDRSRPNTLPRPSRRPIQSNAPGSSEITESLRSLLFGACYGWALPRFCCVCGCFALAPARSRRPAKTRTAPGRPLRKLRSRPSASRVFAGRLTVPPLSKTATATTKSRQRPTSARQTAEISSR